MRVVIALGIMVGASSGALAQVPVQPPSGAPAGAEACIARPTRACLVALALETARSISNPDSRRDGMERIAYRQLALGAVEEARATFAAVGLTRNLELYAIDQLARQGRADEALAAAVALTPTELRDRALLSLAMAYANAGRVADGDAAMARLSAAASATVRATALAMLGHDDAALAAVQEITDPGDRRYVLFNSVAFIPAHEGRRAPAIAAALAFDDVRTRAETLAQIAQELRDPALAEEAIALMRGTPNEDIRVLYEYRVRTLAASGRIADAAAGARAIADPAARALLLAELARTAADPSLTADAAASARAITDPAARARSLARVARTTADRSMIAEAQQAALTLPDLLARENVFDDVAQALLAIGRLDQALIIARSMIYNHDRTLYALAEELMQRQRAREAVELVSDIRDPAERCLGLVMIADALPR